MSVVRKTESVSHLILLAMSKDSCGSDDGKRCLGDGKRMASQSARSHFELVSPSFLSM